MHAGILYLGNSLTVTDSQFTDNIFTSLQTYDSGRVYGGAITLDTGTDTAADSEALSLTIVTTAGNTTIFRNNEINDIDGKRTNSISIQPTTATHSNADATLVISPFSGGVVYLYDPIYVKQDNGAAFEYEFDGKARASVWGYDLKAAKFEGATGIGEAGLVFKPSSKSPWLVDLGVQGYVGKREGVSGSLRVGLEF
ncbi:hypothetical protein AGMMS49925_00340 [Deltaproteobacteria bacterium]|nr:hypothetical protein AGMMS49925_00340 [Deltaproteobacteria bacterium]